MTPSKTLFYLCICYILGVFFESLWFYEKLGRASLLVPGLFVAGLMIISISFWLHKNTAMIVGFCLLVMVLGMMRVQISEFTIETDVLVRYNDNPQKIMLVGNILHQPDVRQTSQRLTVTVEKLIINGEGQDVKALVLVTLPRYPEYHYLDKLQIIGKLKTPDVSPEFNYKNYLQKEGIYSVMDFPVSELLSEKNHRGPATYFYEIIWNLKSKLMNGIGAQFSYPYDTILEGIVYGNDKNMPKDLQQQFSATGLSHITAVSGSNIVILISAVMVFLLWLGFWRGQAFYGAELFIWLYIILIGLPVSGIRAAIMGSVALLAQKLGRQNTSSRVLVVAAVLMLLQNPLLLLYDVSFQLSFLASLGIIYVKPLLDYYLQVITKGRHP
jgi:competence protein ComEC